MSTKPDQPQADVVRVVFDSAVEMEPGSRIPIEFGSESQRESFRVRFYNEKRKYAEQFGDIQADTIVCGKHTVNGKLFLIIEKAKPMSMPYIITPSGDMQPIDLSGTCAKGKAEPVTFEVIECSPTTDLGKGPESDEERRARLMREAGETSE